VRSLLTNLITNALQYSPAFSPVTVTLQTEADQMVITVCDRGRGILTNERQAIQEAFIRGSNVGDIPGTGLGLAVVNTCVTMHRGQWRIDSTEGDGTKVTVTLPLE
jgi:signal transduction histidine kinase